ncbi:NUDIX hydrolase [candidate division KSB1 bacterium]|nr:MAG: NUDIX hydrolase [candidate division KSB1 bacterium]
MTASPHTHRVAVGAYIFHDGRVLLLKRVNSPVAFAPPGGRLNVEEDPLSGLRREVKEETGLDIAIIGLAHVWFGSMDGRQPTLLCVNYLAEAANSAVVLSEEHSDFMWASREDIASRRVVTLTDDGFGYQPSDILESFDRYEKLAGKTRGHTG